MSTSTVVPSFRASHGLTVRVITTTDARNRMSGIHTLLSALFGDGEHIVIQEGKRDMEDTRRGCFQAHQRAATEFLQMSAPLTQFMLVLEDDAVFIHDADTVKACIRGALDHMRSLANNHKKADLMFLGHLPVGKMQLVGLPIPGAPDHRIAETTWSALSHAYIMSRPYAEQMAAWVYRDRMHFDQMFPISTTAQWAVYPMVIFQKDLTGVYCASSRLRAAMDKVLAQLRNKVGTIRIMQTCERAMVSWWWPSSLTFHANQRDIKRFL